MCHSGKWYSIHFLLASIVSTFLIPGCSTRRPSPSPFQVYGSVDTTSVTVGDIVLFQVWARGAGKRIMEFPDLKIENESVSVGGRTELKGNYEDDYGVGFEVSFWDTGSFQIPPYTVNILTSNGEVDYTITTNPVKVEVQPVMKDAQPQLRDIKPPVPLPTVIPIRIISTVFAILLLLGLLVWLWRKRIPYTPPELIPYIPSKPPYDIAIEKLSELKNYELGTSEAVKEFYTKLSLIVREFLEHQFFIRFVEMTTREIELAREAAPIGRELFSQVLDVLARADRAKFARFKPPPQRCVRDLNLIEKLIGDTRLDWQVVPRKEKPWEVIDD